MAAASDSKKVTHKSTAPPLDHVARFGSITGSVCGLVCNSKDEQALEGIFQLKTFASDPVFVYHTGRGKEWEATSGIKYVETRKSRDFVKVKIEYTTAFTHPSMRFLRATPDFWVTYPSDAKETPHLLQVKFKSGSQARKEINLHIDRCVKANYKNCACQCPAQYVDQVFLEMLTSGHMRNDISVSSEISSDYVRVTWDPRWWAEVEPIILTFYDKYLAWYWEGKNEDPEATKPLREFLVAHGYDPEPIFKRKPPNELDVKLMQKFSADRTKNTDKS